MGLWDEIIINILIWLVNKSVIRFLVMMSRIWVSMCLCEKVVSMSGILRWVLSMVASVKWTVTVHDMT